MTPVPEAAASETPCTEDPGTSAEVGRNLGVPGASRAAPPPPWPGPSTSCSWPGSCSSPAPSTRSPPSESGRGREPARPCTACCVRRPLHPSPCSVTPSFPGFSDRSNAPARPARAARPGKERGRAGGGRSPTWLVGWLHSPLAGAPGQALPEPPSLSFPLLSAGGLQWQVPLRRPGTPKLGGRLDPGPQVARKEGSEALEGFLSQAGRTARQGQDSPGLGELSPRHPG